MKDELEKLKNQAEEYLNNWKRERADHINYKKEEARRVEEIVRFANEGLALEIIGIMDNLEIALKNVPAELRGKHSDWLDGIEKAVSDFQKVLSRYDIQRILVEKFDPTMHEVVHTEEGGERVEEVRAGYMIQGKVIRPTRVKIIK